MSQQTCAYCAAIAQKTTFAQIKHGATALRPGRSKMHSHEKWPVFKPFSTFYTTLCQTAVFCDVTNRQIPTWDIYKARLAGTLRSPRACGTWSSIGGGRYVDIRGYPLWTASSVGAVPLGRSATKFCSQCPKGTEPNGHALTSRHKTSSEADKFHADASIRDLSASLPGCNSAFSALLIET